MLIIDYVLGFWISVISDNHNLANMAATGTFYPMILLCGKNSINLYIY